MTKYILIGLGIFAIAVPATARHIAHLDVPYASRGECEAASAHFSVEDREYLQDLYPDIFETSGDVEAFLTRAFTCDRSEDGDWYIKDHRRAVLDSDWFKRR